jgi:hypothetical protein
MPNSDNNFTSHKEDEGCFQKNCWEGWRKFAFTACLVAILVAIVVPIANSGDDPELTREAFEFYVEEARVRLQESYVPCNEDAECSADISARIIH